MTITIGKKNIGVSQEPFIIAEMSGNHNQSLERALLIVDKIAESGAHALKLQTYTAETMTLDLEENEFFIDNPHSLWNGSSLYKLYQEAHTPWEWHEAIFKRAHQHGLLAFSTPFDASAVDFLESLNVPAYKIASFENTDLALIKKVAATGKPLIISTGMASIAEIDEAVRTAREAGCQQLALLKCTSSYPASPSFSNLKSLPLLREMFECEVGLSDHTLGIGAAVASVALGATIIEKHVTLDRNDGGVDSIFSLEPNELRLLVQEAERAHAALGQPRLGASEEERASLVFRRTLYVCEDMEPGEILNSRNLRAIRPGLGLPAKYLEYFIGKPVNKKIRKGTRMSWDLVM